jgi:hypothetical protein
MEGLILRPEALIFRLMLISKKNKTHDERL